MSCFPQIANYCSKQEKEEEEQEQEQEQGIMCEACQGKGWLLCDFCQGQKTNVQAKNNRVYRRCPTCKAVTASISSLAFLFIKRNHFTLLYYLIITIF